MILVIVITTDSGRCPSIDLDKDIVHHQCFKKSVSDLHRPVTVLNRNDEPDDIGIVLVVWPFISKQYQSARDREISLEYQSVGWEVVVLATVCLLYDKAIVCTNRTTITNHLQGLVSVISP
jgi:hypothetical protein